MIKISEYITEKVENERDIVSLKDMIDKKVYSRSGEYVGIVKDIGFSENEFIGIIVRSKSKNILIDKKYFQMNKKDNLVLNIDPITNIKGKLVFDKDGRQLGKIVDIIRKTNSNTFENIIVKESLYSKSIKIPRADIEVMKINIILNKAYNEKRIEKNEI